MLSTINENGPPLVGKVHNDRPFMHHNGWVKKIFLLKNACTGKSRSTVCQVLSTVHRVHRKASTFGGKYQPLVGRVKYDRPCMDHIVRKKDTIFAEYC